MCGVKGSVIFGTLAASSFSETPKPNTRRRVSIQLDSERKLMGYQTSPLWMKRLFLLDMMSTLLTKKSATMFTAWSLL